MVERLRRIFIYLISFTLLFLAVTPSGQTYAQSTGDWFCEETGYSVRGVFYDYYASSPNALALFGYPISNEIVDATGKRQQYFQKVRLDLNEQTGQIEPASLGFYLYEAGENSSADLSLNGNYCRVFSNGKAVCYAFLQFYDANKGAAYLGLPISDTEVNATGHLVQYFENGALEWHPSNGAGRRVQVADLGRIYFDQHVGFAPPVGDNIPAYVQIKPAVDVFVSSAIVTANSTETVFVVVKDQYQRPIEHANVTITITLPDGSEETITADPSNADGITTLKIQINDLAPRDVVHVQASVTLAKNDTPAVGSNWFRVWW